MIDRDTYRTQANQTARRKSAEREYGVVLSTRSGGAHIKVTATGPKMAERAAKAAAPAYRVGRFGGSRYTGVTVFLLYAYAPAVRDQFITVAEAMTRIESDGYVG